jgi:PRA1 family protein
MQNKTTVMSIHAIDYPHLRIVTSNIHTQPLLYPTAKVTPNNIVTSEDLHYESNNTTSSMSSSSTNVANHNGSDDVPKSKFTSHGQHAQQQPIYVNIETMRMQVSQLVTKVQSRVSIDTVRPLHVFFGLNPTTGYCMSSTAFTPPIRFMGPAGSKSQKKMVLLDKSTPEKIYSRVQLNFAYFISNYALLAMMTGLIIALMHPGMVLFVAMVYSLWCGHDFLIRHPLIVFGIEVHSLLSIQQRFYSLFTLTTLVVVWKCLTPTIIFLSISSFLIVLHSLLRDPKDVEASGSSSIGGNSDHRYNYRDDDDDDDDIEGGGASAARDSVPTTAFIDRSVTSPAEKRRNVVVANADYLSKQ